jgi:hypothetical protein
MIPFTEPRTHRSLTYYKYLEAAKRADLAAQMQALGYRTEFDSKAGDFSYDMIAKRGNEKIAFEFKARDLLRDAKKEIEQLTRSAKTRGYDFRLVVVNPPREPEIEIEDLDRILGEYLGMEFSPERVQCAQFIASTLNGKGSPMFATGDVYDLAKLFSEPFDIVLCLGGLFHIPDPPHVLTLIRALTKQRLIVQTSSILPKRGNVAKFVLREDRRDRGGVYPPLRPEPQECPLVHWAFSAHAPQRLRVPM